MDTSKKYIKMCEEAEEIVIYGENNFERLRPLFVFDKLLERVSLVIWLPQKMRERLNCKNGEVIVSVEQNRDKGVYIEEGKMGIVIWLPRQDQLQEMLWQGLDEYEHWIQKLYDFILDLPFEPMSMEQLWLAFIMKEKYNKIWDKDKWLKT